MAAATEAGRSGDLEGRLELGHAATSLAVTADGRALAVGVGDGRITSRPGPRGLPTSWSGTRAR